MFARSTRLRRLSIQRLDVRRLLAVDLVIATDQNPTQFVAGETFKQTIAVRNEGTEDAVGVSVKLLLEGTGLTDLRWARRTPEEPSAFDVRSDDHDEFCHALGISTDAIGQQANGQGPIDDRIGLPAGESIVYEISGTIADDLGDAMIKSLASVSQTGRVESSEGDNQLELIDTVMAAPPAVEAVFINDRLPVRSRVTSVDVEFDSLIDHGPLSEAFTLRNLTSDEVIATTVEPSDRFGKTSVPTDLRRSGGDAGTARRSHYRFPMETISSRSKPHRFVTDKLRWHKISSTEPTRTVLFFAGTAIATVIVTLTARISVGSCSPWTGVSAKRPTTAILTSITTAWSMQLISGRSKIISTDVLHFLVNGALGVFRHRLEIDRLAK